VKLMAAEWKALSEEEKAGFEAKAVEDKERYAKECEEAGIEVKPPNEKKQKKVRRRPLPSPPPAALPLFRCRARARLANGPLVVAPSSSLTLAATSLSPCRRCRRRS
jgi:hypothetical protein